MPPPPPPPPPGETLTERIARVRASTAAPVASGVASRIKAIRAQVGITPDLPDAATDFNARFQHAISNVTNDDVARYRRGEDVDDVGRKIRAAQSDEEVRTLLAERRVGGVWRAGRGITPAESRASRATMDQDAFEAANPTVGGQVGVFARKIIDAPRTMLGGIASAVGLPVMKIADMVGIPGIEELEENRQRNAAYAQATSGEEGFGKFAGQAAGSIASSIAMGPLALLGVGLSAAGQGMTGYVDEVGMEKAGLGTMLSVGAGYGAAEMLAEKIGLDAVYRLGGKKLAGFTKLVALNRPDLAGSYLATTLRAMGVNATEEALTQLAQNAIDRAAYAPDRPFFQGVPEAALGGALGAGAVSPFVYQPYDPTRDIAPPTFLDTLRMVREATNLTRERVQRAIPPAQAAPDRLPGEDTPALPHRESLPFDGGAAPTILDSAQWRARSRARSAPVREPAAEAVHASSVRATTPPHYDTYKAAAKANSEADAKEDDSPADITARERDGLHDVYRSAAADAPELNRVGAAVADAVGGKWISGPIKTPGRVLRKVREDYKGDFTQLKDAVRGTIEVNTAEEATVAIERLRGQVKIQRVKDRFATRTDEGYGDILANVVLPSGAIAEIQVNIPEVLAYKAAEGHPLYREAQALRALIDQDPTNTELRGELADVLKKSNAGYDAALEAARRRASARNSASESVSSSWRRGEPPATSERPSVESSQVSTPAESREQSTLNAPSISQKNEPAGKDAGSGMERGAATKNDTTQRAHKFSSTQLNLPGDVASRVKKAAAAIPAKDLAEDGREAEPHITVKYGLHTDDVDDVRRALAGVAPVTVKLGKTSIFSTDEADVVKVDVESPALHDLNARIAGAIQHTDTHPKYIPHVTLAYVKKGKGKKYTGRTDLEGTEITLGEVTFSDRDGNKTTIPLSGVSSGKPGDAGPVVSTIPAKESSDERAGDSQLLGERDGRGRGAESGAGGDGAGAPGGMDPSREAVSPRQRRSRGGRAGAGEVPARGAADIQKDSQRDSASDDRVGGADAGRQQPRQDARVATLADPASLPEQDRNHVITDGTALSPPSNTGKFAGNLDAIALLRALEKEKRNPTPAEKTVLASYTGWGWAGEYFNPDNPRYSRQYAKLREALTPEEFDSARKSTTNAHYTAPQVISAMWSMVERMGFTGGTVLEPAAGVGHFFGLMPHAIAAESKLIGVELDSLSGRILTKLYPQARIEVKGFQEARIPNNSVDLAISNVPFGSYIIAGKDYNDLRIHDYFFARSLDKVRPGGMVVFITSDGTMDKGDRRVRQMLAGKADLVSAFRLPNDAFQENAGTAVTTDIIILRKRDGTAFQGADWLDTAEVGRWPLATLTDKIDRQLAKASEDYRADRIDYEDAQKRIGELRDERARFLAMADERGTVPVEANEYYAAHPSHALGKHSLAGTMYGAGDYALVSTRGQDLAADLGKAAESVPAGVFVGGQTASIEDSAPLAGGERQGSYIVREGGFKRVVGENYEDADWLTIKKTSGDYDGKIDARERTRRITIATDWVKLREAARALFDAENSGADAAVLHRLRAVLNTVYDGYVKKHGTLTREQAHTERAAFLRDDDDYPLLQSMEQETTVKTLRKRKGGDVEVAVKEWVKGDIFTKRIRRPKEMPTTADTIADAVGISLGYRNTIDVGLVASLRGATEEQAKADIIQSGRAFENPSSGILEPRERYLSGNVRVKLDEARKAAADNADYERNVAALEAVQPARVPIAEVDFNLSSRWIPTEVTSAFASHIFDATVRVYYAKAANGYSVSGSDRTAAATETWGTADINGFALLTHALNGTMPEVRRTVGTGKEKTTVLDKDATIAAQQMAERMQRAFLSWAKTTSDEIPHPHLPGEKTIPRDALEQVYNEVNNSIVPAQYDGSYLVLPGLTDTVRRLPHRLSIVARVLQEGSAVMAHGVGSGKTFSQIVLAMEMRRLGLAKKPMIVVQKATIGQFAASFRQAYPDARILVANERTFSAKNRKRLMAQIAMGDYDAVIVTQPQFDLLDNKPDAVRAFVSSKLRDLEAAIREAKAAQGGRDPTVKQLESAKAGLEARLTKMLDAADARKDKAVYFEELGVDCLLIDEAHAYKRMPIITKKAGVKGIPSGQSQRSMGLEIKASQIQGRSGGKNVILATGTPITNTMAEAYVMLKLATPNVLREYQIDTFDDFANTFGATQTKLEVTWSNKWKMVTRFNRFTNGSELVAMIRAGFDVKMGNKELGLKVPAIRGGKPELVKVQKTAGGEQIDGWLTQVADTFEALTGKERAEAGWVPIFTMQAGMAAALDPRLIDPSLPDEPGSKANVAADRIVDIWKRTDAVAGTQLVFADRFKPMNTDLLQSFAGGVAANVEIEESDLSDEPAEEPDESGESNEARAESAAHKAAGFNLYRDIKGKLIAKGIPEDQIAIIHDFDSDKKREQLFAAVNRGEIRVLIGSTEKMGVGVNVQERLVALHHLDPPRMLTPAMMEQRNGRGVRQGNSLLEADPAFEIEILNYGTERSMDTAIYQKLEDKGKMLAQVLSGKGVGRSFEDAAGELSAVMAEFKAALTGDARVMRKLELESLVSTLRAEQSAHETEQGAKVSKARSIKNDIAWRTTRLIPGMRAAATMVEERFTDPDTATINTGKVQAAGRKDVAKVIDAMVEKAETTIGERPGRAKAEADLSGAILTVAVQKRPDGDTLKTDIGLSVGLGSESSGGVLYGGGATTGIGLLNALSKQAGGIRGHIAESEQRNIADAKQLAAVEAEVGKPWEKAAELTATEKELAAIDRALEGKKEEIPPAAGIVLRHGEDRRGVGGVGGVGVLERAAGWLTGVAQAARKRRLARGTRFYSGIPLDDIIDLGIEIGAKMLAKGITRGPTLTKLIDEGVAERGGHLAAFASRVRRVARRIIKRARGLTGRADPDLLEAAIAKEQGKKSAENLVAKATIREATGVAESGEPKTLNRALRRDQRVALRAFNQRVALRAFNQGVREGIANVRAQLPGLIQQVKREADAAYLRADIKHRSEEARRNAIREAQADAVKRLQDNFTEIVRKYLPPQIRGKFIKKVRAVTTLGQYQRAVLAVQLSLDEMLKRQATVKLERTIGAFVKPKKPTTLAQQINRDLGVHTPAPPLVAKVELRRLRPEHRAVIEPVVKSIRETKKVPDLAGLADFIAEQTAEGRSNIFSDGDLGTLRTMAPRTLDEIRPEHLSLLTTALRHIAWLSHHHEKMRVAGKMMDLAELATSAANEIAARAPTPLGSGGALPGAGPVSKGRNFFGDDRRDTARMLSIAGGRHGVLYRVGYEAVASGEDDALRLRYEGTDALRAVVQRHGVTERQLAEMSTKEMELRLPDAGLVRLTTAERIHLMGLWSDPQNRPEIAKSAVIFQRFESQPGSAFALSEADFDALADSATAFEHDMLRAFKAFANSRLADAANAASREMDGVNLFTNTEHFSRSRSRSGRQQNAKGQVSVMQQWLEDMGILKERSTSTDPIIIKDFFAFADRHVDSVSRYAHLASPVRTLLMLVGHRRLAPMLAERLGTQWRDQLEHRMAAVSGTLPRENLATSNWMRRLVGNTAVVALWGRATTVVLQKLGLVTAAADAESTEETLAILKRIPKLNVLDRTLFHEMVRHSGYLRDRYMEGSTRLVDPTQYAGMFGSGKATWEGAALTKFKEVGLRPMQWLDQDVSIAVYAVLKERIAKENPGLLATEIQRLAAKATALRIRRTQNATSRLDMTAQQLEGHHNPFYAMYTLFSSAVQKMGNQVEEAAWELRYDRGSPEKRRMLAKAGVGLLVSAILGALVRELWRRFTKGFQDEKHPTTTTDLFRKIAADLAGSFVIGGDDFVNVVVGKIQGKPLSALLHHNGFMGTATDIIEGGVDAVNSGIDGSSWLPDVGRALSGVARVVGVPGDIVGQYAGGAVRIFGQPEGMPWSVYAAMKRADADDASTRIFDYIERNKAKRDASSNLGEAVREKARGGRSDREYRVFLHGLDEKGRKAEVERFRREWATFIEGMTKAREMQAARRQSQP